MKFIDQYREPDTAKRYLEAIHRITTRNWTIMEICGGQTHSIVKYGIESLLPDKITLVHGPGCPVCVTPIELIDKAIAIASQPDVIFTSFGDMLRVPGSEQDLLAVKAQGGDIRIVYSPLDAVRIAQNAPGKKVVFFAVGFEGDPTATIFQAAGSQYARPGCLGNSEGELRKTGGKHHWFRAPAARGNSAPGAGSF